MKMKTQLNKICGMQQRGKFIVLMTYIRREERSKVSYVSFHLKRRAN